MQAHCDITFHHHHVVVVGCIFLPPPPRFLRWSLRGTGSTPTENINEMRACRGVSDSITVVVTQEGGSFLYPPVMTELALLVRE